MNYEDIRGASKSAVALGSSAGIYQETTRVGNGLLGGGLLTGLRQPRFSAFQAAAVPPIASARARRVTSTIYPKSLAGREAEEG